MGENYWLIELYSDDTANVSVTSKAEIEALEKNGSVKEWQYAKTSEADEDAMIERAEDKGYEHDPW